MYIEEKEAKENIAEISEEGLKYSLTYTESAQRKRLNLLKQTLGSSILQEYKCNQPKQQIYMFLEFKLTNQDLQGYSQKEDLQPNSTITIQSFLSEKLQEFLKKHIEQEDVKIDKENLQKAIIKLFQSKIAKELIFNINDNLLNVDLNQKETIKFQKMPEFKKFQDENNEYQQKWVFECSLEIRYDIQVSEKLKLLLLRQRCLRYNQYISVFFHFLDNLSSMIDIYEFKKFQNYQYKQVQNTDFQNTPLQNKLKSNFIETQDGDRFFIANSEVKDLQDERFIIQSFDERLGEFSTIQKVAKAILSLLNIQKQIKGQFTGRILLDKMPQYVGLKDIQDFSTILKKFLRETTKPVSPNINSLYDVKYYECVIYDQDLQRFFPIYSFRNEVKTQDIRLKYIITVDVYNNQQLENLICYKNENHSKDEDLNRDNNKLTKIFQRVASEQEKDNQKYYLKTLTIDQVFDKYLKNLVSEQEFQNMLFERRNLQAEIAHQKNLEEKNIKLKLEIDILSQQIDVLQRKLHPVEDENKN